MDNKYKLIRQREFITSTWSGGTTTQLAIYPENSTYANRDFTWRISTAKVEVDESEFTSLPGVRRHIMVLEGEMLLKHTDHHEIRLKKFDRDIFDGDWETKSYGRVVDFNLMITKGCGSIEAQTIDGESHHELKPMPTTNDDWKHTSILLYFLSDMTITMSDNIEIDAYQGDAILLMNESYSYIIHNKNLDAETVIIAKIRHN